MKTRKQDYLIELIARLNANEKRYFKLFNSLQKGGKKYLHLFDELAKAKTYNADDLSAKLKIPKKQLSDDKQYLQDVLLKALRNFDSAGVNRLYNRHMDARALFSRGLFRQALELAVGLIKEAEEEEQFQLLPALHWLKNACCVNLDIAQNPLQVKRQMERLSQAVNEVNTLAVVSYYLQHVRRNGIRLKKNTPYMQDSLLKAPVKKLRSIRAKVLWYQIHRDFADIMRDRQRENEFNVELFAFYEHTPAAVRLMPDGYFSVLEYLYSYAAETGNHAKALAYVTTMQERANSKAHAGVLKYLMKEYAYTAQKGKAWVLCNAKDYRAAVKEYEKVFGFYTRFPEGMQQHVLLHYALSLFQVKDYERSLRKINTVLTANYSEVYFEGQLLIRFLLLLNHIGLRHFSLLPYEVNNISGWMKRNKLKHPEAAAFLQVIKFFAKDASKDKSDSYRLLRNTIQANKLTQLNKDLDLEGWLEGSRM